MKKTCIILLLSCLLTSCGILIPWPESKNYPTTTFYVKNNADKAINFQSTVLKRSSNGPFKVTVPFTVQPKDSVLARKVGFKKDAEPQKWFIEFTISPVVGIKMNNPNKPENWKKGTSIKGKRFYTFTIAE
ncbi:MAG: hypothetical protein JKY44_05785 [Flavobacteriaceae bacterium]|nr:hypothetical protein [Flavobacteriaceae bacterium]